MSVPTVATRRRTPPELRAFVVGALLGASIMFAAAGSALVRETRRAVATSLRSMKSQPELTVEITPVRVSATQVVSAPPTVAPPTIPTWDVRDLPRAPSSLHPAEEGEVDDGRTGDEARLAAPVPPETGRAIFRPDRGRPSAGQPL